MNKMYMTAGLVLLIILSLGAVLAVAPGNTGAVADQAQSQAARPVRAAVLTGNSMTFWDSGTHGFLRTEPDSPGTLGKQTTAADITIPSRATAKFITPLDVPSNVNGHPTVVKKIFLQWNGDTGCTITNVQVFSGFFFFDGAGGFTTNFVGTGSLQNRTVNLGGFFPVSNGLSMQWTIHNSAGSPEIASIYAYGAKIQY
jgi:hypothetical protein